MKQVFLIMLGVMVGWLANEFTSQSTEDVNPTSLEQQWPQKQESRSIEQSAQNSVCSCPKESDIVNTPNEANKPHSAESLNELLLARRFNDAVRMYATSVNTGAGDSTQKKTVILNYLDNLFEKADYEPFIELTDVFLADFYSDIDVLLKLARFNQKLEYYTEAVDQFQLALSYAYRTNDITKINNNYESFFQEVDEHLTSGGRWSELINLYLYAAVAGRQNTADKFRLAEVYLMAGEYIHGRALLMELSSDIDLGDKAKDLISKLDGQNGVDQPANNRSVNRQSERVALTRRGSHYLVPLGLESQTLNLVLDTGASLTTITRQKFDQISHGLNVRLVDTRLFNTANGITRGNVYLVDQLQLGPFYLSNIEIAIMDFDMGGQADGLLGMNTLRNFQFEIDQDSNELVLQLRN
ncbi:retropepsin-like aspartic protease [Teredinibacter sp. KSP-S5-2]|uniref:retropepsin-like aspartic protease family protein n=1 Tax=Teredinibacter sp. KSP-S5-2 TaxID=3034506 RepID=UPI0029352D80|nr:retropepsin-like aspartic protease [Teredinibacter sp. KSP-S5-2]WNO09061.1 retropepsin-like aspartic protease [Teredinibacter sp. KSP-S5-2]